MNEQDTEGYGAMIKEEYKVIKIIDDDWLIAHMGGKSAYWVCRKCDSSGCSHPRPRHVLEQKRFWGIVLGDLRYLNVDWKEIP